MSRAEEEAIDWIIRLSTATAEDWEQFTRWLEASAEHVAAYGRLSLVDADAVERLRHRRPEETRRSSVPERPVEFLQSVPGAPRFCRRYWMGGIAAGVVAAIGAATLLISAPAMYAISSPPGEKRGLALADGSRIELDGGTRLVLDRHNPRSVELAYGEAMFTVVHDDRHPFEVRAGAARITDVGTAFDVSRRGAMTEVAVASGAIAYRGRQTDISLSAGDRLQDTDGDATPTKSRTAPGDVAGWRSGRRTFRDRRYADIAADLYASSGVPLRASPSVADRRFTGVINTDGSPEAFARRLEVLLDVKVAQEDGDWLLLPAGAAH